MTSPKVNLTPALNELYALLEIETPETIIRYIDQLLQGWIGSPRVGDRPTQKRLDLFDTYRYFREFVESIGDIQQKDLPEKEEKSAILEAINDFRLMEGGNNSANNLTILWEGWQESPFPDFDFGEDHRMLSKTYCALCDFAESLS